MIRRASSLAAFASRRPGHIPSAEVACRLPDSFGHATRRATSACCSNTSSHLATPGVPLDERGDVAAAEAASRSAGTRPHDRSVNLAA
jgi:hypothetical protein